MAVCCLLTPVGVSVWGFSLQASNAVVWYWGDSDDAQVQAPPPLQDTAASDDDDDEGSGAGANKAGGASGAMPPHPPPSFHKREPSFVVRVWSVNKHW